MANLEWLTIAEACRILKVSRRTLYSYMESGTLPYYQAGGDGHRRILAEDLTAIMILASSPSNALRTRGSGTTDGDVSTQIQRPWSLNLERDYSWMPEYHEDLERLRPLGVWAGHPCALCGDTLRGVVTPEVAEALLKDLAHKECIMKRQEGNWFPITIPSLERRLYEAE